jgi:hypothetical protein
MAKGVLAGLNTISAWKSKTVPYQTKFKVLQTCVFSTAIWHVTFGRQG